MIFDNFLAVAIDCEWGSWNVNHCSSTCGPGTRTKQRTVSIEERHGGKCRGKNVMKEPCIMKKCPSKGLNLFFLDPNIFLCTLEYFNLHLSLTHLIILTL